MQVRDINIIKKIWQNGILEKKINHKSNPR